MNTFKLKDTVNTPNGHGRIITLPIGKYSQTYLVLHEGGRAVTYEHTELQPVEAQPCPPPTPTILPN